VPISPMKGLALSTVLFTVASITACGDDGGGGGDIQDPSPVASVTITAPTTEIRVGETVQLTATARDADGNVLEGKSFEWTSGIGTVASVSPTGLVTGLVKGQSEIRATTEGVTGSIVITVDPVPPPDPFSVGLQEIASGLEFPTYLASPPLDDRLFVLEKDGVIRLIKGGMLLQSPFLDIRSKVSTGAEQGLLGVAFFPDYAASGRFIVHYTDHPGNSRISLFRVSADPDRADPVSESEVIVVSRPGIAHNGGQVLFGPDGFLYIGLGDGDDDDGGRGQSVKDLLGSILRIDVSSAAPYTVPADNPFMGTAGARPEVWSYGLRNPWRFSFDRVTGDLYIADVGESRWEEVDYASVAEGWGRGVNYGWSVMEGTQCFRERDCDQTGITLPVLEYGRSDGCSITGGYVYRGDAIPTLQGHYFYADYCAGWVRSFRIEGGVPAAQTDWPELRPGGLVTSFGEDGAGELYLVTQQGSVFKIVPGVMPTVGRSL
jgi:glucose/arabinose dehydrogenase